MAFSKANGNELWVQLLEKAWAKINGSYENTITGLCMEAFRTLTGAPVDYYHHDYTDHEKLWVKLREADQKKFIICASSSSEEDENGVDHDGIVSEHAYSVLSLHEPKT